jgi:hypothetical protein
MAEENPIRWTQDLAAAAWIGARLDGSGGRVTSLVPAGYEAYARIIHSPATFPRHQLPATSSRTSSTSWAAKPTTPDRCWFCVDDHGRGLPPAGEALIARDAAGAELETYRRR